MIKVENHEVTMFGDLEELSAEITLHALEGVKSYEEHVIPVVKK